MKTAMVALGIISILAVGVLLGVVVGWALTPEKQTIAIAWGDGKYGPSFYGAEVYVLPSAGKYSVRGVIWIGPGNGMWHDCGELAQVNSVPEAIQKWGKITWKKEGLYIGKGDVNDYFLPQATVERHR